MHVAGGVAMLIGGMLAAAGHDVLFLAAAGPPRRANRQLRVVLPDGWQRVSVGKRGKAARAAGARGVDLALVAPGEDGGGARTRLTLLPGTLPTPAERTEASEGGCAAVLALMRVVQLEEGEVELVCPRSCLLIAGGEAPETRSLAEAVRRAGVEVAAVDELSGRENAWALSRLLLLPAALCRSSREHFLSYPQGREIARRVLEEGIQTLRRLGRPLERLPLEDPVELVERIGRAGQSFAAARFLPGAGCNELLQGIARGERVEVRGLNERLVRLAAQAGVEARWNWALARKLGRLQQGVFYRSPAELYEAIG